MYFLIGSEFSDRVPQNVKFPQAQRRFQRVAFALLSVEANSHMRNGNTDGQITVEPLQLAFKDRPDLLFRHFPEATVAMMRWQCGRTASDVVDCLDGYGAMIAGRQVTALDTNTSSTIVCLSLSQPSPGMWKRGCRANGSRPVPPQKRELHDIRDLHVSHLDHSLIIIWVNMNDEVAGQNASKR